MTGLKGAMEVGLLIISLNRYRPMLLQLQYLSHSSLTETSTTSRGELCSSLSIMASAERHFTPVLLARKDAVHGGKQRGLVRLITT